jgi:ferredoxin
MPNCKIDKDACIGCGLCVGTHPEIFAFADDGKAEIIGEGDDAAIEDAAANCPVGAIAAE